MNTAINTTPTKTMDHYFIIISNHNIAEFRSCLEFKPKNLHIIITQKMEGLASLFINLIKNEESLKKINIHQLKSQEKYPLGGDDTKETITWIEEVFKPHINNNVKKEEILVFNMTGGTKILSNLILQSAPWSYVNYIPLKQNNSNTNIERLKIDENKKLDFYEKIQLNTNITPYQALKLYIEKVKPEETKNIKNQDALIKLAKLRFQSQRMDKATTDNPFKDIIEIIEQVNKKEEKLAKFNWTDYKGSLEKDIICDFFKEIYTLFDCKLEINNDYIEIPTSKNNRKKEKRMAKWISGIWFEDLILHHLKNSQKISNDCMISNVQIEKNEDKKELDIVITNKHNVYVLEIKSDISEEQNLTDIYKQIEIANKHLGMFKKYLVISSIIKTRVNEDKWNALEALCRINGIKIIEINTEEDIYDKLICEF